MYHLQTCTCGTSKPRSEPTASEIIPTWYGQTEKTQGHKMIKIWTQSVNGKIKACLSRKPKKAGGFFFSFFFAVGSLHPDAQKQVLVSAWLPSFCRFCIYYFKKIDFGVWPERRCVRGGDVPKCLSHSPAILILLSQHCFSLHGDDDLLVQVCMRACSSENKAK